MSREKRPPDDADFELVRDAWASAQNDIRNALRFYCDDIEATVRELEVMGVEFSSGVTQQRWGLITTISLPGGGRLGLYEPLHASPLLPPS